MRNPKTINYFAYGELLDGQVLKALLDRDMGEGKPAALTDHELCVQGVSQIPDYIPQGLPTSARQIIRDNYGDDFKTYIIRRQNGSRVEGRIYRITKEELGLIDDWELREFAWYEQNRGIAQTAEGEVNVTIHTDSAIPHPTEKVVEGKNYRPLLENPEFMIEIARKSRRETLERMAASLKER